MQQQLVSSKGVESGTTCEFQIRQLMPANGAKAVFFHESTRGDVVLKAVDCCFLGLASERITYWRKGVDGTEHPERVETIDNVIVCVDINGGYEQILNEAPNFAGIQMPGQEIRKCIGQANSDFLARLPRQDSVEDRSETRRKTKSKPSHPNSRSSL